MADKVSILDLVKGAVVSVELAIPVAGGYKVGEEVSLRLSGKKLRTVKVIGIGPGRRSTTRLLTFQL